MTRIETVVETWVYSPYKPLDVASRPRIFYGIKTPTQTATQCIKFARILWQLLCPAGYTVLRDCITSVRTAGVLMSSKKVRMKKLVRINMWK